MAGGRPTDYKEEYSDQVKKLCLLGATDKEIADFFGVCEKTINNWKEAHPEFLQSIRDGKKVADMEVAGKLYERATGFAWTEQQAIKVKTGNGSEETVEVVDLKKATPPDVKAITYWLNNRDPDRWRDKSTQEHTGKDGKDLIPDMDDTERARRTLFAIMMAENEKK